MSRLFFKRNPRPSTINDRAFLYEAFLAASSNVTIRVFAGHAMIELSQHSTASVAHSNGSVVSVAKIDGDGDYRAVMRNQTWLLPQDDNNLQEVGQVDQSLLFGRLRRLQPWLRIQQPLPAAIHTTLADLSAAFADNATSQITSAGVVLPLSPSQDLKSRFVTAAPALGLNELKLHYPASIWATYPFSTPDFYTCSSPEHGVPTVDYSDAGPVATKLVDECGLVDVQETWHDLAFLAEPHTADLASGNVNASSFRAFINDPMKPWSTDQLLGMAKIILTGSHGATPGLRNILTSALTGGAYEGKLDEMLVPQRGALEPLFVVSTSAAKESLRWQQDAWAREAEAQGVSR
nr:hypothetical protein B0A51_03477 [Rachicladosporium sp. CCFEE 5018]